MQRHERDLCNNIYSPLSASRPSQRDKVGELTDRQPPDLRKLGQRRPKHRPDPIPGNKDRQSHERGGIGDVEVLGHGVRVWSGYTGRVNGGANVDGEGEGSHLKGDEGFVHRRPVVAAEGGWGGIYLRWKGGDKGGWAGVAKQGHARVIVLREEKQ